MLSGRGFGGQLAHALAAKLLLQLQQEITLAKQMGINLSALSQTEDKVHFGREGAWKGGGRKRERESESEQTEDKTCAWW